MRQKTIEIPNENPIKCVILVLGFLSLMATFTLAGLLNERLLFFNATTVVGFTCGLIALPVGFKLIDIWSDIEQNPDSVTA